LQFVMLMIEIFWSMVNLFYPDAQPI
jgi:hypothetical protein